MLTGRIFIKNHFIYCSCGRFVLIIGALAKRAKPDMNVSAGGNINKARRILLFTSFIKNAAGLPSLPSAFPGRGV